MIIDRVLEFFLDNMPTWQALLTGGPLSLIWAFGCLSLAGYLKSKRGFKTGYSRKVFHFLIFGSVAVIQWQWGTPAVCLFGGMTSLVVFYAVLSGSGNLWYEAIARENDHPHRSHYILVPYLATLIGGLTTNILFGPLAVIGYLVTGLGDAVGEPVGTKFGKHTYRTPSLTKVKSVRSLEGSAAVGGMSLIAIILGIALTPELAFSQIHAVTIPLLAAACVVIEAVSPHGWDNATLQIFPVWLATLMW